MKAAGFNELPEGHRRLPEAAQGHEGQGHAGRLRAGQRHRRRPGCNWLLWSHGGKLVDKNNKVVIDSPETIKALEYAKEMYASFVTGHAVAGWTRTTTRPSSTARSA
jgi:multiple sugar transport system substrate-binding protein